MADPITTTVGLLRLNSPPSSGGNGAPLLPVSLANTGAPAGFAAALATFLPAAGRMEPGLADQPAGIYLPQLAGVPLPLGGDVLPPAALLGLPQALPLSQTVSQAIPQAVGEAAKNVAEQPDSSLAALLTLSAVTDPVMGARSAEADPEPEGAPYTTLSQMLSVPPQLPADPGMSGKKPEPPVDIPAADIPTAAEPMTNSLANEPAPPGLAGAQSQMLTERSPITAHTEMQNVPESKTTPIATPQVDYGAAGRSSRMETAVPVADHPQTRASSLAASAGIATEPTSGVPPHALAVAGQGMAAAEPVLTGNARRLVEPQLTDPSSTPLRPAVATTIAGTDQPVNRPEPPVNIVRPEQASTFVPPERGVSGAHQMEPVRAEAVEPGRSVEGLVQSSQHQATLVRPATIMSANLTMPNGMPVTHPDWSQAMSERVVWAAGQQVQRAAIQLDPPELGSLQIKLQISQDQVSVSFVSPHANVRDAVEQSMPRLRELLAEQGLNLSEASVNDQQQGQAQRQPFAFADEEAATRHASSADSGMTEPSTITGGGQVGLVDYYA